MELKAAFMLVAVLGLLVRGFARRWGTWSARQWMLLAARLGFAVILLGTWSWMAKLVDAGGTEEWSERARVGWALTLVASGLGGTIVGLSALFHFGTDEPESERRSGLRVGLAAVVGLVASAAIALYLASAHGVALERSAAMLAGLVGVAFGAWGPRWLLQEPRLVWLTELAGPWAVRALYLGVGLCLIILAIMRDGIPLEP